jgi:hypothetical protein
MKASGLSMTPFIHHQDVVTIQKVPEDAIGRGDLILFKTQTGSLILHRIIKLRRAEGEGLILQTKGDALPYFDAPISEGSVLGKVSRIEKKQHLFGFRNICMDAILWRSFNFYMTLKTRIKALLWRPWFRSVKMGLQSLLTCGGDGLQK